MDAKTGTLIRNEISEKYEWTPYDWEGAEYLTETESPPNRTFNAMVAISLLSTGMYLITRGIVKTTK